ncbi:uncharacterized protein ACA1_142170 [Acanthamoeba castellanii str. Neff]|uniref:Uncharacterized protein n=1 Tax=Acanthamoeba castellanii (strain ATCC 30010 / Neff) TaxID=1257118 RepID=L8HDR2_ACACF|nr:uncharacterized protein ACA1_142170 [Acanthamoeba castellanii str. Neff]ELR22526.1 hypothetical protein ACA1_142170 [Acanthamoeba castellanii str. Neff]
MHQAIKESMSLATGVSLLPIVSVAVRLDNHLTYAFDLCDLTELNWKKSGLKIPEDNSMLTPLATSLPDQLTLCTHDGVEKIKVCFVGGTITLCGRQTALFDRVTTSGDGSSLHAHGRDPEGKLWSVKLGFTSKSAHPRADCDWDDIEQKNLRAQEFEPHVEPDTSKEVIHEKKKKKKKTIDDDEVWVGIKAWSGGMAVFGLFITWLRSID